MYRHPHGSFPSISVLFRGQVSSNLVSRVDLRSGPPIAVRQWRFAVVAQSALDVRGYGAESVVKSNAAAESAADLLDWFRLRYGTCFALETGTSVV